jgi:hypothetical protein
MALNGHFNEKAWEHHLKYLPSGGFSSQVGLIPGGYIHIQYIYIYKYIYITGETSISKDNLRHKKNAVTTAHKVLLR